MEEAIKKFRGLWINLCHEMFRCKLTFRFETFNFSLFWFYLSDNDVNAAKDGEMTGANISWVYSHAGYSTQIFSISWGPKILEILECFIPVLQVVQWRLSDVSKDLLEVTHMTKALSK